MLSCQRRLGSLYITLKEAVSARCNASAMLCKITRVANVAAGERYLLTLHRSSRYSSAWPLAFWLGFEGLSSETLCSDVHPIAFSRSVRMGWE